MNILVFCHYYPPEVNAPASRTSEHAKIWAGLGHDVTVVTCTPNHPTGKPYPGYRNRLFQRETRDGVEVVRVWTYLAANEGFGRRIVSYLSYLVAAVLALPRLGRPDIILSTSPQFFCGLAGLPARWSEGAPWVLEIRDLWPESIVSVGAMRKGFAIRFLEWLERLAYRKADRVVSVTDGFVPHIEERRGRHDVAVIKNGVDLSLFRPETKAETGIAERFGLSGRLIAAYVGTHGVAHGLDTILDAAALLRDDPRIGFLLVGDGAERRRLADRAEAMGLPNLAFAGQLPKEEMPAVWSATDVSLIVLKKSDTFKTVLPSKMFEAMAMRRPIVLGVEGEAAELLQKAGAGIAIEPQSAEALANAVKRFADDRGLAERYGASGAAYVRTHFDRSDLARRYLDLFAEVAA